MQPKSKRQFQRKLKHKKRRNTTKLYDHSILICEDLYMLVKGNKTWGVRELNLHLPWWKSVENIHD